jgi:hypothetical protein
MSKDNSSHDVIHVSQFPEANWDHSSVHSFRVTPVIVRGCLGAVILLAVTRVIVGNKLKVVQDVFVESSSIENGK